MALMQARALAAARAGVEWGAYRALNGSCAGRTTLNLYRGLAQRLRGGRHLRSDELSERSGNQPFLLDRGHGDDRDLRPARLHAPGGERHLHERHLMRARQPVSARRRPPHWPPLSVRGGGGPAAAHKPRVSATPGPARSSTAPAGMGSITLQLAGGGGGGGGADEEWCRRGWRQRGRGNRHLSRGAGQRAPDLRGRRRHAGLHLQLRTFLHEFRRGRRRRGRPGGFGGGTGRTSRLFGLLGGGGGGGAATVSPRHRVRCSWWRAAAAAARAARGTRRRRPA